MNGICRRCFWSFYLLLEHLPGVFGNSQFKSLSFGSHRLICVYLSLWGLSHLSPSRLVDDHTGILISTNTNTHLLTYQRAPFLPSVDL